jgi:hypothetical protein
MLSVRQRPVFEGSVEGNEKPDPGHINELGDFATFYNKEYEC